MESRQDVPREIDVDLNVAVGQLPFDSGPGVVGVALPPLPAGLAAVRRVIAFGSQLGKRLGSRAREDRYCFLTPVRKAIVAVGTLRVVENHAAPTAPGRQVDSDRPCPLSRATPDRIPARAPVSSGQ